jgi:hypothetical protein
LVNNGTVTFTNPSDILELSPGQLSGDGTGYVCWNGTINADGVDTYNGAGLCTLPNAILNFPSSITINSGPFYLSGIILGLDGIF